VGREWEGSGESPRRKSDVPLYGNSFEPVSPWMKPVHSDSVFRLGHLGATLFETVLIISPILLAITPILPPGGAMISPSRRLRFKTS